jgi:hypothetical protein
MEAKD